MNALFLLYALTVSLELLLSLLMAIFLYLIIAPRSRRAQVNAPAAPLVVTRPAEYPEARRSDAVSDPTATAIRKAMQTITQGENDMQILIQARRTLQLAERDLRRA